MKYFIQIGKLYLSNIDIYKYRPVTNFIDGIEFSEDSNCAICYDTLQEVSKMKEILLFVLLLDDKDINIVVQKEEENEK